MASDRKKMEAYARVVGAARDAVVEHRRTLNPTMHPFGDCTVCRIGRAVDHFDAVFAADDVRRYGPLAAAPMNDPASPAPETRTADTCSGCGKSISGPRFCLSCLERVDVTIDAPETRMGEGAPRSRKATGDDFPRILMVECTDCRRQMPLGEWEEHAKSHVRAPSPREGTP